jgi:hypothetical protein
MRTGVSRVPVAFTAKIGPGAASLYPNLQQIHRARAFTLCTS